jgi:hypothetical protein
MDVTIPGWKINLMNDIKNKLINGSNLVFVHTPKCGGTYANECLSVLGVKTIGHTHPTLTTMPKYEAKTQEVYFTIIREPVERFESFLNFRLWKNRVHDFPMHIKIKKETVFKNNQEYTLNEIMNELHGFNHNLFIPYRNLKYWTTNIDLCITIKEFLPFMKILGYDISKIQDISSKNVSIKNRGTLDEENKQKIREIYKDDIEIYNYWTKP